MKASQRGFTLLEMLIAIAITALLVTAAVQAHIQILQSQRAKIYERGRDVTAERVVDRLERELLSALLVAKPADAPRDKHPWVFQGADGGNAPGAGDSIRFITYNAGGPGSGATGLRLISYVGRRGAEERMELFRDEADLPSGLPKSGIRAEGSPSLRGVEQFQLRYRDEKTGTWQNTWDSTQQDTLPKAVEITLQLAERNEAGEIVDGTPIQRIVPLLVRPIAAGGLSAKNCKEGTTVGRCPGLQGVLPLLSADEQKTLAPLLQAAANECALDDPPSDAVAALKEFFSEGLENGSQLELEELCQK